MQPLQEADLADRGHDLPLQPHRSETFKLSSDPLFVDKVRDIVGLYLDPPDRALVLCVDEKSQIQALDRTQTMLPVRSGQAERRTHDYNRHGTTTLFAALDVATGADIASCMRRHRAREFRAFLDAVERAVPADLDIHVVMDNASSHKTRPIRDWFARRPHWHRHFTPTSASWLNQVERFFALLKASLTDDVKTAFAKLDENIQQVEYGDLGIETASQWLDLPPGKRERTGVIAPTRALRDEINATIRTGLVAERVVVDPMHSFRPRRVALIGH